MLPVINITFLLLLFFIVVGNFSEQLNRELVLPASLSQTAIIPEVVELALTEDGELVWQGEITTVQAWADTYYIKGLPLPDPVRLRADANTPAVVFLPILDDFKHFDISQVALVTQSNESGL